MINTRKEDLIGTSLVVQGIRFSSKAGDKDLIPGQGAKIPHASRPKKSKHETEALL